MRHRIGSVGGYFVIKGVAVSDLENKELLFVEHPLPGVCQITLNRPQACNALNQPLLLALLSLLNDLEDTPACVLIWLRGQGRHFCAGMDLKEAQAHAQNRPRLHDDARLLLKVWQRWQAMRAMTLVSAQGACMGGGCGFLAAADVVIADASLRVRLPEVRHGLSPIMVAPFLMERMGYARTRYLALTCRELSVAASIDYGLVDEVVPAESDLMAYSHARIASWLEADHSALLATKRFYHQHHQGQIDLLKTGADLLADMKAHL